MPQDVLELLLFLALLAWVGLPVVDLPLELVPVMLALVARLAVAAVPALERTFYFFTIPLVVEAFSWA